MHVDRQGGWGLFFFLFYSFWFFSSSPPSPQQAGEAAARMVWRRHGGEVERLEGFLLRDGCSVPRHIEKRRGVVLWDRLHGATFVSLRGVGEERWILGTFCSGIRHMTTCNPPHRPKRQRGRRVCVFVFSKVPANLLSPMLVHAVLARVCKCYTPLTACSFLSPSRWVSRPVVVQP
ncbi:hypothetical protein LX36DRAFT_285665 [Colletotrichum falcatum]|nr:hypothetical protein LX36DRAFT_285665 [Colletotrichum falcatum]